jgi:hypothetical protein
LKYATVFVKRPTKPRQLPSEAEVGYIGPQPGGLQYPDTHTYNYHYIQNRFDAGSHGNVAVDQMQYDSGNDQHNNNIQQRHFLVILESREAIDWPIAAGSR